MPDQCRSRLIQAGCAHIQKLCLDVLCPVFPTENRARGPARAGDFDCPILAPQWDSGRYPMAPWHGDRRTPLPHVVTADKGPIIFWATHNVLLDSYAQP